MPVFQFLHPALRSDGTTEASCTTTEYSKSIITRSELPRHSSRSAARETQNIELTTVCP
jgi:hypothetical protein